MYYPEEPVNEEVYIDNNEAPIIDSPIQEEMYYPEEPVNKEVYIDNNEAPIIDSPIQEEMYYPEEPVNEEVYIDNNEAPIIDSPINEDIHYPEEPIQEEVYIDNNEAPITDTPIQDESNISKEEQERYNLERKYEDKILLEIYDNLQAEKISLKVAEAEYMENYNKRKEGKDKIEGEDLDKEKIILNEFSSFYYEQTLKIRDLKESMDRRETEVVTNKNKSGMNI
jgi:hypothetical protein